MEADIKNIKSGINKEKMSNILFWTFLLFFLIVFFVSAHPLVPYDADDWTYIGCIRNGIPMLKVWNPIKVFPETFEGICGYIAGYIVYPLCGDFVNAVVIVNSIVYAMFIFAYFVATSRLFNVTERKIVTFLFVSMHFIIFKSLEIDNKYMFGADNVNAVYNYTLPALLNCITIVLIRERKSLKQCNMWIALCIYLSIFSNMFNNIILVVFASVELLFEVVNTKMLKETLRRYSLYVLIVILWMISLFFERSGGRASNIGKN